jgi:hypothetical protein
LMPAAPAPAREVGAAAGARQRAAALAPGLEGAVGEVALALRAAGYLFSDRTQPGRPPVAARVGAVAQPVQKDLRRSALPWEEGEEVGA